MLRDPVTFRDPITEGLKEVERGLMERRQQRRKGKTKTKPSPATPETPEVAKNQVCLSPSDPFEAILIKLWKTHKSKSADYGTYTDPLANLRASEHFGIKAYLGALIRQHDKIIRIQSFLAKGKLENEPIEDALLDNAVYSILAYQLYLQSAKER